MRIPPTAALALTLYLGSAPAVQAQNVSLDEGAFRLSQNGVPVGREEFSIRRIGLGDQARIVLRGDIQWDLPSGRQQISAVMAAEGVGLEAQEYQVRVTGPGALEVYVARSGARYTARVLSSEGEQVREFRAGPGSVLLDQDVAHHHHLLTPFLERGSSVSLTVLSPRGGQQVRMTLSRVGDEEMQLGGALIQAQHFRLEGDGPTRDLWFDGQGRLLRIQIEASGYLAERESLT